ncbi:MAG: hypothetical protein Q4E03_04905 [Trueperella sp.]|nr:hypothetical protein [Trueperella sp.]
MMSQERIDSTEITPEALATLVANLTAENLSADIETALAELSDMEREQQIALLDSIHNALTEQLGKAQG